jgi:hypothetical protein
VKITQAEFIRQVIEALTNGDADIKTDNEGQLVIFTGVFEQADTTLSDEPDPNFDCEHENSYINDRMEIVCSQCGRVLGR